LRGRHPRVVGHSCARATLLFAAPATSLRYGVAVRGDCSRALMVARIGLGQGVSRDGREVNERATAYSSLRGVDRGTLVLDLRHSIERLIDRAGRQPGWRLPSEPNLAARFAVARGTVREALKLLEQDGVINVVHGSGRYVSALGSLGVDHPITVYESITDMLRRHGYEPSIRVLSVKRRPAEERERAALDLPLEAEILRIERIRSHADTPLVVSIDIIDATLAGERHVDEDSFAGSLCDWLARRGRRPASSVAEIRASDPPTTARAALGDEGQWRPCTLVTERCIDRAGRGVLYAHNYLLGDLVPVRMVRRPPA